jgi:hypothetical protein
LWSTDLKKATDNFEQSFCLRIGRKLVLKMLGETGYNAWGEKAIESVFGVKRMYLEENEKEINDLLSVRRRMKCDIETFEYDLSELKKEREGIVNDHNKRLKARNVRVTLWTNKLKKGEAADNLNKKTFDLWTKRLKTAIEQLRSVDEESKSVINALKLRMECVEDLLKIRIDCVEAVDDQILSLSSVCTSGAHMGLGFSWTLMCVISMWAFEYNLKCENQRFRTRYRIHGDDSISLMSKKEIALIMKRFESVGAVINVEKSYYSRRSGVFCEMLMEGKDGSFRTRPEMGIGESCGKPDDKGFILGVEGLYSKSHGSLKMIRQSARVTERREMVLNGDGSVIIGGKRSDGGGGSGKYSALTLMSYIMYGGLKDTKREYDLVPGEMSLKREVKEKMLEMDAVGDGEGIDASQIDISLRREIDCLRYRWGEGEKVRRVDKDSKKAELKRRVRCIERKVGLVLERRPRFCLENVIATFIEEEGSRFRMNEIAGAFYDCLRSKMHLPRDVRARGIHRVGTRIKTAIELLRDSWKVELCRDDMFFLGGTLFDKRAMVKDGGIKAVDDWQDDGVNDFEYGRDRYEEGFFLDCCLGEPKGSDSA